MAKIEIDEQEARELLDRAKRVSEMYENDETWDDAEDAARDLVSEVIYVMSRALP